MQFLKQFIALTLILVSSSMFAATSQQTYVNVLSWWGYLDDPKISHIVQTQCHVHLSYDEYYSNQEFLKRFEKAQPSYDIIIFSNIMYGVIKNQIKLDNSTLSQVSENYYPFIKEHYQKSNFPGNVAYFSTSIMGFLWNPSVINLSQSDSIIDAFKKAQKLDVVLVDDPMEANNIMRLINYNSPNSFAKSGDNIFLTSNNIKKITGNSNIYISNDYGKIYSSPKFAFAYLWSGDAFYDNQQQNNKYNFLATKNTSYICTDLIAQLNNNPATTCVARVLASKQVLNIVQNSNFYFSPYGDSSQITDARFKQFYNSIFPTMATMPWIAPISKNDYAQLEKEWSLIKINLHNEQH